MEGISSSIAEVFSHALTHPINNDLLIPVPDAKIDTAYTPMVFLTSVPALKYKVGGRVEAEDTVLPWGKECLSIQLGACHDDIMPKPTEGLGLLRCSRAHFV